MAEIDEKSSPREQTDPSLPILIKQDFDPHAEVEEPALVRRIFSKLKFIPLFMIFAATIGVVALYFQPPGLQKLMGILRLEPGGGTSSPIAIPAKPRAPAPSDTPPELETRTIVGLGKLVPEGDVRTVAAPFGAGDANIETLLVREGELVKAGDVLAILDNRQNLEALVQNAETLVASREASLEQIRNSILASQQEARASLQRAQNGLKNAEADFERTQALFDRGFTTRSNLDQKRLIRDQAKDDIEKLTATLARFSSSALDEQPDVIVAARNLDAAKSDLRRAKGDLSKSKILAPIDGTILKIHARSGERPGTKGVLDIANIDKMNADVEVYQSDIASVALGAPVELTADALSGNLTGEIIEIGLEVGSQTLIGSSPAANTDARVIIVKVGLDEASSQIARQFTNLQVIARIEAVSR